MLTLGHYSFGLNIDRAYKESEQTTHRSYQGFLGRSDSGSEWTLFGNWVKLPNFRGDIVPGTTDYEIRLHNVPGYIEEI